MEEPARVAKNQARNLTICFQFFKMVFMWFLLFLVGDEGDFLGREELRLGGHGALAQGIA